MASKEAQINLRLPADLDARVEAHAGSTRKKPAFVRQLLERERAREEEEQIEQIHAELLRALQRIERSLKITGRAARPVKLDQTSVGRLSRIDALQNQQLTQGLQARENARYAHDVEALQRIERGTYGICAGCEQPIPFERLLVFPETLRCAACGGDRFSLISARFTDAAHPLEAEGRRTFPDVRTARDGLMIEVLFPLEAATGNGSRAPQEP